jgi:5-methyltetrahydropteroyltriglutamate--homocysteine methyltransferase
MIVGSAPQPAWLARPFDFMTEWRLSGESLEEGQDDAVRLALDDQHDAGVDIVTDGEQRRRHYVWSFCEGLSGIDSEQRKDMPMRGGRYRRPAPVVTGPVRRPRPITLDAFRFTREHTGRPVKVTLPSPMTLADSLFDEHYRDRRTLALELAKLLNEEAAELAEAGCEIVQLDEPCFNIYLDEMEEWGIQAMEDALSGVRAKTAVHVCYGYGVGHWVEWKAENTDWRQYERVLPLLATSTVDQISVECAASGVHSSVLALAEGKELAVGVIDCGSEEVETPEVVAARLRLALRHVPPERLFPSTDCGLKPRSRVASRWKMRALADGARIVRQELSQRSVTSGSVAHGG